MKKYRNYPWIMMSILLIAALFSGLDQAYSENVVPSAPTLVSLADGATLSGTSVTFSWKAASGAIQYWLRAVRIPDGAVLVHKNVGNVTSYTQSEFPNNSGSYIWAVAAGNSAGWSYWSDIRKFTLTAPPPVNHPVNPGVLMLLLDD